MRPRERKAEVVVARSERKKGEMRRVNSVVVWR